jgi:hypothetical protein
VSVSAHSGNHIPKAPFSIFSDAQIIAYVTAAHVIMSIGNKILSSSLSRPFDAQQFHLVTRHSASKMAHLSRRETTNVLAIMMTRVF